MYYVHVEANLRAGKGVDYSKASIMLSKRTLVSLIHGLKGQNFGFDSTLRLSSKIQQYKTRMNLPGLFTYVDSGGYSIIKGDVPFVQTEKFINCYTRYLEHHEMAFDYIFSLDIPYWGNKEDEAQLTRSNLYKFNKSSLGQSLDVFSRNKAIADKWFFVWQFALTTQYEVWKQLFEEFQINSVTSNYAIGGQVGIRERFEAVHGSALTLTAFTAMAVKCLSDHLSGPLREKKFRLHVLGIYHPVDRFQLILLDKIFGPSGFSVGRGQDRRRKSIWPS